MSKAREFNGDLKPVLSGFHTVGIGQLLRGNREKRVEKTFSRVYRRILAVCFVPPGAHHFDSPKTKKVRTVKRLRRSHFLTIPITFHRT